MRSDFDDIIKEHFSKYKLSPTGIRNFLQNKPEIREYIQEQINKHPEYYSFGGYIRCLVEKIDLPKCRYCNNKIDYRKYTEKRPYCSYACFKKDFMTVHKHTEETTYKRYGAKNCSTLEFVKEKRKKTNLKKFGVENVTQNPDYVKKAKNTMLKKYGVDSYIKTEKSKRKHYRKSYKTILSWHDYIEPLFTFDEYHGWKHNEVYKWRCVKCGNVFEDYMHVSLDDHGRMPRCLKCFPLMSNTSLAEKEVVELVRSIYHGEIIENDRKLIKPLELDIVIPEYKLAIEYNGLFWHNDKSGKDKYYHLNKTLMCEKAGYKLIHIYEDDWRDKNKAVKSFIASKLNIYDRIIDADNLEIKEVDKEEADIFIDENSFSEKINSSVRLGAYLNDELICLLTARRSHFKVVITAFVIKNGLLYRKCVNSFHRGFKMQLQA